MSDLTNEAKEAIAEAVRIVREDKFAKYVKTTFEKHSKPGDPPPPPDPKDPPTDPPVDPPADPPKSRYWGDIFKD